MKKKRRSAFLLESLEARLLFSADLAPLPVDGGNSAAEMEPGLEISLRPDNGGMQASDTYDQERREVIFVDEAVDDIDQLIADLESQREKGRQFDIVGLDSDHDGIAQISDYLRQQQGVDAVHILSHGTDGEVILGNSRLNATTLDGHAEAIEGWQQALSGHADLLFYGCNLAAGDDGQDLVNSLALLTGADVAASEDVTGSAKFGGDWVLEYGKGEIETAVAVGPETQQNWNGVLANFIVNTTDDTIDASPGDGIAEDAAGNVSLRAAIMEANALAGADSITLSAGTYTLSIAGTGEDASLTGDLDITSDLNITGLGAGVTIIDGGGLDRVFHINWTGNATITNLTIQNGGNVAHGGGIRVTGGGGGGRLNLDNVIVRSNTASVNGGGIFVDGVVTLTDVEISGNTTSGTGGGLSNDEQTTLMRVTISGNSAADGGGIYNSVQGNLAELTNVTISGNTATADGGGIYTARLVNLTNVTVASNLGGGGIYVTGGQGEVELKNSILADNTGGNSNNLLTSLGYNIEDGNSAFTPILGDQPNTDPTLGPLQNNGGFTQTHALLPGSPAIDPAGLSGAPPLDQRGASRDGLPDIGAFESRNNALVVDTTSDTDDGDTSTITTLIGNKGADGRISLREAIIASNNTANLDGPDWIHFNISGAGTHTIAPTSALPTITDAVTIDATTDDSFAANGNKPAIVLEGNDFGFGWNGLVLSSTADGSTIRGLVIRNWDADGIVIQAGSDNNVIVGNYIGRLNPNGTASGSGTRNNGNGIYILGSNNIIGGTSVGAGNLISGNGEDGIRITGAGGNVIQGNYLGTNAAGNGDLGNSLDGILIDDSANNVIGGTTTQTRNIISGNNIHGVRIVGPASTNNTVQGNYIGVNASGSGPLGNTYNGIWVATGASNNLIGGTAPGAGNVISGNSDTGIEIQDSNSTGNRIEGNIIGLNAAGTAAIGNLDGVIIEDAPSNTIGGATSAHRNVISGNTGGGQGNGVVIFGTNAIGNLVQNNDIGTDITGTLDQGNAGSGVLISDNGDGGVFKGGASGNTIRDNVLSGNNYSGVSIANPGATNNFIFGNFIGADASGLGALGNSVFGVVIWNGASGNRIGGTAAGEGNVIAFNNRGVIVDANFAASMNNAIRGNSIHSNALLGIDLKNDGVTVNDSGDGDFGPNGLRNYPVITSAVVSGIDLTVTGTLNTLSSLTNQIDFYWSPAGDLSGHGEGQTFIGTTNVTSDFFGNASFNVTFFGVSVPVGAVITATATDLSGNTSEFAQNVTTIEYNEAPVVIAPGSALNATEQIGLAIQGMGFSVSDADEAGAGALATLAVGEGTISVVVGNSGVTIDSGDGTDAVTLSGSIAQLNALLTSASTGTITYLNNSDTPGSSTTLTVTVNDQGNTGSDPGLTGDGSSEEGSNTVDINITSVNDEPTLTTTADNPTFTEGGAAAGLFSATSVSTIESGQTITGLTLTVTNVNDADNEKLNLDGSSLALTDGNSGTTATNSFSYSISVSGTTATITLSGGTLTTAATQTLVDTISYQNDSDDPDTANRVVTLTQLVDSGGSANGGDDTATLSVASTVTVVAINDAPVLADDNPTLTAIDEDNSTSAGDSVAAIVVDGSISDPDGSPVESIAITAVDDTNGTWQYSTDNGTTWADVDDGALAVNHALLLDGTLTGAGTQKLRFVPTADYNGTATFTFKAWDQSSGSADTYADSAANTAFSSATDTAAITINAINDAPVLADDNPTLTAIDEDNSTSAGDSVAAIVVDGSISDPDGSPVESIAITAVDDTNGTWQYSTDNGTTWADVDDGALAVNHALLLDGTLTGAGTQKLRFVPTADYNGTATFTFKAWDQSSGSADTYADSAANTAFSSATDTAAITINAINDAPTITSVANTAATEDLAYSYTFTVNDVDVGDTLTLSAPTLPTWLSFDPATGILSGTPTNAEVGNHAVVLRVNDGTVDVDQSFTITVANTNDAGTVTIDNTTPTQGDTLTANVIDPDGASGAISFQWFSDGAAIGGATGKTYTTTQADVGRVITVTAVYTDALGTAESLTSAGTAAVANVNETPIAVNDHLNVTEDHSMTFNSVTDLLANDSDIDGDTLTISGFTQPANGTLADNGDGTFTYTPTGNFNGNDSFTYSISDGNGETATGTAIIVVAPVGDTPQVSNVSTNAEAQSGLIFINRNANDGPEVTHFKLSGITNGTLYLADGVTRIDNGDFITVSQGQAGLRFTPAPNSAADGSFNVESSEDGVSVASQSGIATSIITVLTTAPQPSASEHSPPLSDPEQVSDDEVVEEENEDVEDLADDTDVQADANNMFTVETPQSFKAPGIAKPSFNPGITLTNRADSDSDEDKTPKSSTLVSPQTLKLLLEAKNLGELKAALVKLDITTLSPDAYELMRSSLDAVKEEIGKEMMLDRAVLGSAIATSVGLSAGYVVWMLKGGSLLASVLSSLPAWQFADPLAILVGKKEEEDDQEDDSLETIIEEGSGRDESKKKKALELDNVSKGSAKQ